MGLLFLFVPWVFGDTSNTDKILKQFPRSFLYRLLEGTGWQNGMFMEKSNVLKVDEAKNVKLSNEVKKQVSLGTKKKKAYVKPVMQKEEFISNEYIAACGNLYCALPGNDPTTEDGSTPYYVEYWTKKRTGERNDSYHGNSESGAGEGDWEMGPQHGGCANGSTLWRDGSTAKEITTGGLIEGVTIGGQTGTDSQGRKIYSANWVTGNYSHVGFIHIDANRPNHS